MLILNRGLASHIVNNRVWKFLNNLNLIIFLNKYFDKRMCKSDEAHNVYLVYFILCYCILGKLDLLFYMRFFSCSRESLLRLYNVEWRISTPHFALTHGNLKYFISSSSNWTHNLPRLQSHACAPTPRPIKTRCLLNVDCAVTCIYLYNIKCFTIINY